MFLGGPDVMENMAAGDAGRIYGELQRDWNSFSGNNQRLISLMRTLFWAADRQTNGNPLYGGACVFCGGHVEMQDGAAFAYFFRKGLDEHGLPGGERISSHQSEGKQYEIALPRGWGTLLFGTRNNGTWFQNEGYPITTSWADYIGHVGTTIQYGASVAYARVMGGQALNIGAKGRSPNNDQNPLRKAWNTPQIRLLLGVHDWV